MTTPTKSVGGEKVGKRQEVVIICVPHGIRYTSSRLNGFKAYDRHRTEISAVVVPLTPYRTELGGRIPDVAGLLLTLRGL
jgi:hypothetical protein